MTNSRAPKAKAHLFTRVRRMLRPFGICTRKRLGLEPAMVVAWLDAPRADVAESGPVI